MGSNTGFGRATLLILAAGFSFGLVLPAVAQAVPADENPDTAAVEATAADADEPDIKDLELDWSQLNVDASTLIASTASKARLAPAGPSTEMTWSSRDKPDGAAAVAVKQPLSPIWDTRIGADMTVTR
jgi:hypothetical protein